MMADAPKYDYSEKKTGVTDMKSAKVLTKENAKEMMDYINKLNELQ